MRLTYFGHSCFLLETATARLVFDPNLTANPHCPAGVTPASLRCDYVLLSHGHEDHCCDALALAQTHGATIVGNYEIAEYFHALGAKSHGLNPGGSWRFPFGRVKLTLARHSSSMGDPRAPIYLGEACGVLVEADGKRVYHAGDTALFSDLHLVGRLGLDVAMVPIGDNYTMGPEDAIEALDLLKPTIAVPMHYNTWPVIAQDPGAFARNAADHDHEVRVLAPGGILDF